MNQIGRLFQAFLAPALFVSATSLLILSVNVRLMGIVTRLREYVHEKYDAAKNDAVRAVDAYTRQIESMERRAEMIRRSFLLALLSLAGTICSCLLLGLGLYLAEAAWAAAFLFVISLGCLLGATVFYISEVATSLHSVRDEARDLLFMDLGGRRTPDSPDRP
jgi:ABC-type glycerol-3-phosphate transport system permease component